MKYNVVFCCFIAVDVGVVIVVFDVDVGVGIRFFSICLQRTRSGRNCTLANLHFFCKTVFL